MPSTRSKLILDEESFQGLLAAAFTIQQYNGREGGIDAALSAELNATLGSDRADVKDGRAANDVETEHVEGNEDGPAAASADLCQQCGAALPASGVPCAACDAEIFRPGERLQRTWATMWSMSQEQQSQFPGRIALPKTGGPELVPDIASASEDKGEDKALAAVDLSVSVSDTPAPRLMLRFKRADLYLGLAILVALVALLWPAASARRAELRPWERVLIAMGIADPPAQAAEIHYSGDPNIKVWVDTEAALYYCPGDELYGKSRGGYYSTQHEAQLDRFEPALRRACVQ
ncbi:MAG: hypothetical protein WCC32_11690 [Terriglobales bacterium]